MKNAGFFQKLKVFSERLNSEGGEGVYLIEGTDELLRKEAVHYLLNSYLTEDQKEFGFENVDMKEITPHELAGILRSPTLFGDKRFIWLKNFLDTKDYANILSETVSEGTRVIVTNDKLDRRKSLFLQLSKLGRVFELQAKDDKYGKKDAALVEMIQSICERAGKRIDSRTCHSLLEKIGSHTGFLELEVEKLICFIGNCQDMISLKDVDMISSSVQPDTPGYILADNVADRDICMSLTTVREIFLRNEEPLGILAGLLNRFRLLLQGKDLLLLDFFSSKNLPQNYSPFAMTRFLGDVPNDISEILPKEPRINILKQHIYRIFIILNQCSNFSRTELLNGFEEIVEMFYKFVTTQVDEKIEIERLIMSLCGIKENA
ncbi:MAG: hypothetical protein P9M03_02985 [Candidatus Theseobacter exili]|nr:hypothetical protein [Candidatus Theseobacter exili]